MAASLCGGVVDSRRGMLASLWSVVTVLTVVSFLLALIFTLSDNSNNDGTDDAYYNDDNKEEEEEMDAVMAVTSRAMAFAALWTAVLATLMGIFGTVVLGWQSPTGQYYTCCSVAVHRTTPLALGSFIGALLMFANLTLVCSVLFGEFEIRDYQQAGEDGNGDNNAAARNSAVGRSSMAFSIMCMFLTILYAGFAAVTFIFSKSVLEELARDEPDEAVSTRQKTTNHFVGGYDGYIGERFDVRRNGAPSFVAPQPADGTLT